MHEPRAALPAHLAEHLVHRHRNVLVQPEEVEGELGGGRAAALSRLQLGQLLGKRLQRPGSMGNNGWRSRWECGPKSGSTGCTRMERRPKRLHVRVMRASHSMQLASNECMCLCAAAAGSVHAAEAMEAGPCHAMATPAGRVAKHDLPARQEPSHAPSWARPPRHPQTPPQPPPQPPQLPQPVGGMAGATLSMRKQSTRGCGDQRWRRRQWRHVPAAAPPNKPAARPPLPLPR